MLQLYITVICGDHKGKCRFYKELVQDKIQKKLGECRSCVIIDKRLTAVY